MDFIPFEKVSISEAKAALDKDAPPDPEPENFAEQREKDASPAAAVSEQTKAWLEQLPKEIRPFLLCRKFPRIANKLAELWTLPLYCDKYMDALMLDQRGTRKGFPEDIAKELSALRVHFVTNVAKQHFNAWGDRIG